jgi:hypothetical protein
MVVGSVVVRTVMIVGLRWAFLDTPLDIAHGGNYHLDVVIVMDIIGRNHIVAGYIVAAHTAPVHIVAAGGIAHVVPAHIAAVVGIAHIVPVHIEVTVGIALDRIALDRIALDCTALAGSPLTGSPLAHIAIADIRRLQFVAVADIVPAFSDPTIATAYSHRVLDCFPLPSIY